MKFCTQCGTQLDDNSKFCTNCGNRIEEVQQSAPQEQSWNNWNAPQQPHQPTPGYVPGNQQPPKKNKTGLIIGLVAGIVAIIVLALVFLFAGEEEIPVTPTGPVVDFTVPEAAAQPTPVGYWELLKIDSVNPDSVVTEEDASLLREVGYTIAFEAYADGTGYVQLGERMDVSWDTNSITYDGETVSYRIEGDVLELYDDETSIYFTKTTPSSVPPATEAPAIPAAPASGFEKWNGDYYGWWIVSELTYGSGEGNWYEEGNWWDACCTLDLNSDGTGNVIIWDEDLPKDNAVCEITVNATIDGDVLRIAPVSGYFMDGNIAYNDIEILVDWDDDFEDVLTVFGTYSWDEAGFDYYMFMRPWGHDWADVKAEDPDLLPYNMDWYEELIAGGVTKAPNEIG